MKSLVLTALFILTPVFSYSTETSIAEDVLTTCLANNVFDVALEKHVWRTEQSVTKLSCHNRNVGRVCTQFMAQLLIAYRNGEGFIEKDIHKILDAVSFSAKKHQFQTRKDEHSTPYIIHPIDIAYRLLTIGNVRDSDILIAALLHDTVEDTETSFEEIREIYGCRVENFVRELTDDKNLSKLERKKLQIVNAPYKSAGATQIKLADQLSNLSDMLKSAPVGWSKERLDQYFMWTAMVVNGLPWVNAPLKKAVDSTIDSYWNQH